MRYQHILIWICLTGWAWVFPSAEKIHSVEEWIDVLGYDAESSVSEEDLISVQQLITSPVTFEDAVSILSSISIISLADIKIINNSKNIHALQKNNDLSPAVNYLVQSIQIVDHLPINLALRERISFNNGVRHYWRVQGSIGSYNFGILLEKDPLEQNIADHNSIYMQWNSRKLKMIAGDHQLVGGYGLVSWRTVGAHKGFETINTLPRHGKGMSTYRSSNEYWSTRGIAGEWTTYYGQLTFSLGRTYRDGSVENGSIKLDITGQHITTSDLLKQDQLLENAATVMWSNELQSGRLGLLINTQKIEGFSNAQVHSTSASVFGSKQWNDWNFFGEISSTINNSSAFLGGALFKSKALKYLVSFRYYPTYYRTYRTQSFSEWAGYDDGETGIFQNVQIKYNRHHISIYNDIAEKIEENNPAIYNDLKNETGIRWRWQSKKHHFLTQYRKSDQSETTENYYPGITANSNNRITIKGLYKYIPTKKLDLRWQINSTIYNNSNSGLGFETRAHWKTSKLVITGSWIAAKIDNYNSRVYFWDLNLPGEMNSVAVSDNKQLIGIRIQIKGKNNYQLYMRWRATWNTMNFTGTPEQRSALAIQIIF